MQQFHAILKTAFHALQMTIAKNAFQDIQYLMANALNAMIHANIAMFIMMIMRILVNALNVMKDII